MLKSRMFIEGSTESLEAVQVAAKLQAAKAQRKAVEKLIHGITKQGL